MDAERDMLAPIKQAVTLEIRPPQGSELATGSPSRPWADREGLGSPARYDGASVAVGPWRSWERV
jgi:hypothetical protein